MARNYYRILGLAPYAEDVVIQAAYRALMRRYHPDTNASADAKQRAAEINEAYEVLSNPTKRARYDAELKVAQAKQRTTGESSSAGRQWESQSPPPRPPQPPKATESGPVTPPPEPSGLAKAGWVAGGIGLILLVAALSTSPGQDANTMNVDENAMPTDLTDMNMASANTVEPPKPIKLSDLEQSPIQFDDVETAASQFARVLMKRGIAGARATSEKCHKDVTAAPSWEGADRCAAFDFAAAYIDKGVATASGWEPFPYFQFQADNQSDRYEEAGAYAFSVNNRLTTIKEAAERSVEGALRSELARRAPRSEPSAPTDMNATTSAQNVSEQTPQTNL